VDADVRAEVVVFSGADHEGCTTFMKHLMQTLVGFSGM
jgi:hypothetical protein